MSYVLLATFSPALNGQLVAVNTLPGDTDLDHVGLFTIFSFAVRVEGKPTTESLDIALGELTEMYHTRLATALGAGTCGLCGREADAYGDCYNHCWVENPLGHEIKMKEDA